MAHEVVPTPVLILTGPVGVGKSAVADQISHLLGEVGAAHALIDMDWLRSCYPSPADDPFHEALGLQNLATVSTNYRAAGARRLILVDIVESRGELASYREAIPGAEIIVVRLTATLPTIVRRLEGRESGEGLRWHQNRAAELVTQMDEQAVEDLLIETEGKTVLEVARDILTRIGWTRPVER